jgi:hypothetical protein
MTAATLRTIARAADDAMILAHDGPDPAHVAAGARCLRRLAYARRCECHDCQTTEDQATADDATARQVIDRWPTLAVEVTR